MFDHLVCFQYNVRRTDVRRFWEGVLQLRVFHQAPFTTTLANHRVPDTGYSVSWGPRVRGMQGTSLRLIVPESLGQ